MLINPTLDQFLACLREALKGDIQKTSAFVHYLRLRCQEEDFFEAFEKEVNAVITILEEKEAAPNGYKKDAAHFLLGVYHLDIKGNKAEALKFLELSAHAKNPWAPFYQYKIHKYYEAFGPFAFNKEEVASIMKMAMDANIPQAFFEAGGMAEDNKNYQLAFQLYDQGMKLGCPLSTCMVGKYYAEGTYVAIDPARALNFYKLGKELDQPAAYINIATWDKSLTAAEKAKLCRQGIPTERKQTHAVKIRNLLDSVFDAGWDIYLKRIVNNSFIVKYHKALGLENVDLLEELTKANFGTFLQEFFKDDILTINQLKFVINNLTPDQLNRIIDHFADLEEKNEKPLGNINKTLFFKYLAKIERLKDVGLIKSLFKNINFFKIVEPNEAKNLLKNVTNEALFDILYEVIENKQYGKEYVVSETINKVLELLDKNQRLHEVLTLKNFGKFNLLQHVLFNIFEYDVIEAGFAKYFAQREILAKEFLSFTPFTQLRHKALALGNTLNKIHDPNLPEIVRHILKEYEHKADLLDLMLHVMDKNTPEYNLIFSRILEKLNQHKWEDAVAEINNAILATSPKHFWEDDTMATILSYLLGAKKILGAEDMAVKKPADYEDEIKVLQQQFQKFGHILNRNFEVKKVPALAVVDEEKENKPQFSFAHGLNQFLSMFGSKQNGAGTELRDVTQLKQVKTLGGS
jgi:hypothetical protein